jgi:hypothetical protein
VRVSNNIVLHYGYGREKNMADNYSKQAEEALKNVLATGDAVRNKRDREASFAIILAATEEVKKIIDATSAVGRILIATLLDDAAWKLGTGHPAFQELRDAANTLNPQKK